ncbi:unnamed protein product [Adineta steineri]|uniref:Uncharacterized protein n=1 Tax=Adineta steineri TaxID=433720 RepID=A0A815U3M2_9BILA|nr:unnamed protein product [Adineta steineri]
MCSECKSIFRAVGCLNDLQTGEEKPLSSPVREVPPECSPQHGVLQEPPCQDEEKPQELSSSPERAPQAPFPNPEARVTQEPPEPQPMSSPLPTHQDQLIVELEGRLLHYQEEITLLKFQWVEYKT